MLTRKHFTAVAAIIKAAKNEGDPAHAIVRDLADLFKQENAAFNRAKFYKAAGYEHYHAPKLESGADLAGARWRSMYQKNYRKA